MPGFNPSEHYPGFNPMLYLVKLLTDGYFLPDTLIMEHYSSLLHTAEISARKHIVHFTQADRNLCFLLGLTIFSVEKTY